jgi:hypothetical protein
MIENPLCAPCLAMLANDFLPIEDPHGNIPDVRSFDGKIRFSIENARRYGYVKTPPGDRLGIFPRTLIENTLMCQYHAQVYYIMKEKKGGWR